MIFAWYKIFNLGEFEDTGLVSRILDVNLEGKGQTQILLTSGNTIGVTVDDVFLPVNFLNQNPFYWEQHAVALDESGDVWLGYEQ